MATTKKIKAVHAFRTDKDGKPITAEFNAKVFASFKPIRHYDEDTKQQVTLLNYGWIDTAEQSATDPAPAPIKRSTSSTTSKSKSKSTKAAKETPKPTTTKSSS